MKRITKTLFIFVALTALLLSLTACGNGIKADRAKADTGSFFDAIKAGNYELAATYLHPDRPVDLKTFFEGIESKLNVDFSDVKIVRYTGVSVSVYDSDVGGSCCELDADLSVSGVLFEAEIEFVKNDAGYGIYNFGIDKED